MRKRLVPITVLVLLLSALDASALVITEGYTTDFIVLYTCGYYLSIDRHPNTLGTFAVPQWGMLVNNEPVYVIAHGHEGMIGTMNGMQLAAWIGAPLWYTTEIYATSCESGLGNPSLITTAADESRSTRTFTGYAGCAIGDSRGGGTPRVVMPTQFARMAGIQGALMTRLQPQAEIDNFVLNYQMAHAGANPPLLLLAQYAFGNQVIRQFYAELLVDGQRQGCFYQTGKGVISKQGKQ